MYVGMYVKLIKLVKWIKELKHQLDETIKFVKVI